MWTFETRYPEDTEWRTSSVRCSDPIQAAIKAAAFMSVCAENDVLIEVRLSKVPDGTSVYSSSSPERDE